MGFLRKKNDLESISLLINATLEQTHKALQELVRQGVVSENDGFYTLENSEQLIFYNGDQENFHHRMIKDSVQETLQNIDQHFSQSDSAIIESCLISVKKERYQELLENIRLNVNDFLDQIESEEGDTLVNFNFFLHPLISKKDRVLKI